MQMTDDSNTRASDTYVAPQLQRSLWSHVFKVSSLVPFMGSGNNWGFLSFSVLPFASSGPILTPFHRVSDTLKKQSSDLSIACLGGQDCR